MPCRSLLLPFVLVCATALAGCSNSPDGQSVARDGLLAYNGASAGTHQTKTDCDGSGTIHWSANLGSGSVTVTVLDGEGASKYSRTFSDTGQTSRSDAVAGAPGDWTVKAERKASGAYGQATWSGQYEAHLEC